MGAAAGRTDQAEMTSRWSGSAPTTAATGMRRSKGRAALRLVEQRVDLLQGGPHAPLPATRHEGDAVPHARRLPWLKRLAGQLREHPPGRGAAVRRDVLGRLKHVFVDIQGGPHESNITHQASDVNRPRPLSLPGRRTAKRRRAYRRPFRGNGHSEEIETGQTRVLITRRGPKHRSPRWRRSCCSRPSWPPGSLRAAAPAWIPSAPCRVDSARGRPGVLSLIAAERSP